MSIMNNILSFLGLGSPPPSQADDKPVSRGVRCQGWARPDPAIRLRLENNTVIRILGYPESDDIPPSLSVTGAGFGNAGTPFLYLRGTVPAYVDYIMGSDWRSKLHDNHEAASTGHGSQDWAVILRQDGLNTDEREHCLRMRRCGATGVRSEVDIIESDGEGSRRGPWPSYEQLFGWPATGGVWILRNVVDEGPFQQDLFGVAYDSTIDDEIQERFRAATQRVKQQADMEGICRVIEQAGGQFYPDIQDCFEVVHFRLLE